MTHYEQAQTLLEAHATASDRERRNIEYERALLLSALVEAVLSVCDELAGLAEAYGVRNP